MIYRGLGVRGACATARARHSRWRIQLPSSGWPSRNWRICTWLPRVEVRLFCKMLLFGMRLLGVCWSVMSLDSWQLFHCMRIDIFFHMLRFVRRFIRVHDSGHTLPFALSYIVLMPLVASETANAFPTTGAASLTLVMPCKSVPSCKATVTFRAYMRPLASMKFCMAFQIMEPPETRIASFTAERLFLAMCKKMALEVMMSGEVSAAIGTLVSLGGRRGIFSSIPCLRET